MYILKNKEQSIVLASGAFDLVHYGHVHFLKEAKKVGGRNARLIVIIARDKTIEKRKGKSPVIPENQRRAVIESLKPVDEAFLGYEDMSFIDTIQKLKPSIIAVGYDQEKIEEEVSEIVEKLGLNIQIVKIDRFGPLELSSSSKIKKKILNEWK
jgi:FAD synthetase